MASWSSSRVLVWALVWLCLDGVVAIPRDRAFLLPQNPQQENGVGTSGPNQQLAMIAQLLKNPDLASSVLRFPGAVNDEQRPMWEKIQGLLQVYESHGMTQKIGELLERPGIAAAVAGLSQAASTGSLAQVDQFVGDVVRSVPHGSGHDTAEKAAGVVNMLAFAPPSMWAWFNPYFAPGQFVPPCAGNCTSESVPGGGTLAAPCQVGAQCDIRCPESQTRNPRVGAMCACPSPYSGSQTNAPIVTLSNPLEPLCVLASQPPVVVAPPAAVVPWPPVFPYSCLNPVGLLATAAQQCTDQQGCPKSLSGLCCEAMAHLRACDPLHFAGLFSKCPQKGPDAATAFATECGLEGGMCPFTDQLDELGIDVDCPVSFFRLPPNTVCRATCKEGFTNTMPLGSPYFRCSSGILTRPTIHCEKQEEEEESCPVPASLAPGLEFEEGAPCVRRGRLLPGEVCGVQCAPGFMRDPRVDPPKSRNFGPCANGQLPEPDLKCTPMGCVVPQVTQLPSGVQFVNQSCHAGDMLAVGRECTLACKPGFQSTTQQPPRITCSSDLRANLTSISCEPIPCKLPATLPALSHFASRECVLDGVVQSGSKCAVECDDGYERKFDGNQPSVTDFSCALGRLTSPNFRCIDKSCKLPESLPLGMEYVEGQHGCEAGGSVPSGSHCKMECRGLFMPSASSPSVTCNKGETSRVSGSCVPNVRDPNVASCQHVNQGSCVRDYITCQASAVHVLSASNTDRICLCMDQFTQCLGDEKACLDDAQPFGLVHVSNRVCGSDCRTLYKAALGMCADTDGKCLSPSPFKPCCTALESLVTACPIASNGTLTAQLYNGLQNHDCQYPLRYLLSYHNEKCAHPESLPDLPILPGAQTPTPTPTPEPTPTPTPTSTTAAAAAAAPTTNPTTLPPAADQPQPQEAGIGQILSLTPIVENALPIAAGLVVLGAVAFVASRKTEDAAKQPEHAKTSKPHKIVYAGKSHKGEPDC